MLDSSEFLDDAALCELPVALGHLSSTSLGGLATTLDGHHGLAKGKEMKAVEVKTSGGSGHGVIAHLLIIIQALCAAPVRQSASRRWRAIASCRRLPEAALLALLRAVVPQVRRHARNCGWRA